MNGCDSIIIIIYNVSLLCWLQLVELKNGETYNGHLVQCDSWMNMHLREVICTSKVWFVSQMRYRG